MINKKNYLLKFFFAPFIYLLFSSLLLFTLLTVRVGASASVGMLLEEVSDARVGLAFFVARL